MTEMTEEKEESHSEKYLAIGVILIVVVFGIIFLRSHFFKPEAKTIEEKLKDTIDGKADEDEGYIYNNVYPFYYDNGFWYTQIKSPKGTKLFQMPFRYGPRDVENIQLLGNFNESFFNENDDFYVTFDPVGEDLTHIQLAVGDFDAMIINVLGKMPIAACANGNDPACENRPIVTCQNKTMPVIYFRSSNETGVFMTDTCVILSGRELDIVRSTDRFLLGILGIMPW